MVGLNKSAFVVMETDKSGSLRFYTGYDLSYFAVIVVLGYMGEESFDASVYFAGMTVAPAFG